MTDDEIRAMWSGEPLLITRNEDEGWLHIVCDRSLANGGSVRVSRTLVLLEADETLVRGALTRLHDDMSSAAASFPEMLAHLGRLSHQVR